jgi:exopolysaccharide/PEP-CTERM locus tyrosine autokinase
LEVLQKYDHTTYKLDINAPNIGIEVLKRLQFYRLIQGDGTLTPAGLDKCSEPDNFEKTIAAGMSIPSSETEPLICDKEAGHLPKYDNKTGRLNSWNIKIIKDRGSIQVGEDPSSHESAPKNLSQIKPLQAKDQIPQESKRKRITPDEKFISVSDTPDSAGKVKLEKRRYSDNVQPAFYDINAINKKLVSFLKPQSFAAEQYKILRTNLLYPISGKAPQSVLVSSTAPGEGKSFVAANLAASIAMEINRYVLLIDCDLRQPALHYFFGFNKVPGLSDYLTNSTSLESLLLRTAVDKLTILPAGSPPANPSELLSSKQMSAMLEEATTRYADRIILIDSPPPSLTAEARVLASQVDGVLIVLKCGSTKKEMVTDLIEMMGREKVLGAVVNDFDIRPSNYNGKYFEK